MNKKNRMLFCVFAISSSVFLAAAKPSKNCDEPITFSSVTALDFSEIDGSAGTGNITMGSNGVITYGAGYSGAGIGTGGMFLISGEKNCTVSISCSNSATLTDGSGGVVGMLSIQIRQGTSGAFGTGTTCLGLGTPIITDYKLNNNTANNDFYIGAALNTSGGVNSPNYTYQFSTAKSAGAPVTIEVEYD